MMESVDKLRGYGHDCCARIDDAIHDYCDDIEREIAERYMELPVDAGGVPIRVGDILERVDGGSSQQACCICPQGFNDAPIWCARDFRHVKPRTIIDVLSDFAAEVEQDNNTIETARKYAEEIRELLEVGE